MADTNLVSSNSFSEILADWNERLKRNSADKLNAGFNRFDDGNRSESVPLLTEPQP